MSPIRFSPGPRFVSVIAVVLLAPAAFYYLYHLEISPISALCPRPLPAHTTPSNLSPSVTSPVDSPKPQEQFVDLSRGYTDPLHETSVINGIPGFYYFKNVYTLDDVLYAVTDNFSSIPPTTQILCDPYLPGNPPDTPPGTEKRWRVISTHDAQTILGRRAARLQGITMFFNDGPGSIGFLMHYFHFVCEAFAGGWRALRSANDLRLPTRVIFARGDDWRDPAMMNAWFLNSVLPMTAVEDAIQWEDRALSKTTFVLENVVVIDRHTAHRHGLMASRWNKMTGDVMSLPAPEDWWEPLRSALLTSLDIPNNPKQGLPVITYVDRQLTSRRLLEHNHEALLQALHELADEGLAVVHDAVMETLSKQEQFGYSSQTDILLGVHGNGLSHQMWMKPGGVVIEMFMPGGFMRDYELLAESLQHDYYAIWNTTIRTRAEWESLGPQDVDGFHSPNIPVDAEFMKGLLKGILKDKYGLGGKR